MRGVTLAWKKRERDRETEKKKKKNPIKSHSEQKTAQFSCLCCEFCRLGWKTSSTVRADISATLRSPKGWQRRLRRSSEAEAPLSFFVFVWEFKKRKEIHIHAPTCAPCTARRPATVKSVYLNERKLGLSEFIVVFFLFFFFHTQR